MESTTEQAAGMALGIEEASRILSLYERMQRVKDRRERRGRRYEAATVLTLLALAKLAGEKTISGLAHWVRLRGAWLRELLPLSDHRLPCANTYQYICDHVDMAAFVSEMEAFKAQVTAAKATAVETEAAPDVAQLVVDGKVLRGSDRQATTREARILVSAYHVQERRVWKQVEALGRGGEAKAAMALIGSLNPAGLVVSADALHTRPAWCRRLREAGGHYLLIAKQNRPDLREDIALLFRDGPFPDLPEDQAVTVDKAHGRLEQRRIRISAALTDYLIPGWPDVAQVFEIERLITARGRTRREYAYGLTSLPPVQASASQVLCLVRQHWHIENCQHWRRDVTLGEDACQVSRGQTPILLALLNDLLLFLIDHTGATNAAAKIREFAAHPELALKLLFHPL